jgi:cell division protein FtsX
VDWGKVQFFLGEVFTNFTRNAAMQLTAIGTVAVTIVMLGSFLYVRETISSFGQGILKQIEIAVYLNDDVTDAQAKSLAAKLAADERVSAARYVPRAAGLKEMRARSQRRSSSRIPFGSPSLPGGARSRSCSSWVRPTCISACRSSPKA